jgi:hypothetical protein
VWYIDQEGDFVITIDFTPQKFYRWALIVTLVTFVAIVVAINSEFLRRRLWKFKDLSRWLPQWKGSKGK